MPTCKNEVYAVSETKLKDKSVSLLIGSEMNRLAVGDLILHDKSSEADRAAVKAYLMNHPKASLVDMFLSLIVNARGREI